MATQSPWQIIKSHYVHTNNWFKVKKYDVITPAGNKGEYNVIEFPASVTIVVLNEKQEICLTEEYRFPHQEWMWQLPIGAIDKDDKTTLAAAKRELQEETGLVAASWSYVGQSRGIKGATNHIMHTYIAQNIQNIDALVPQSAEGIKTIRFVSTDAFFQEIRDGKIMDNETISSITLALLKLGIL